MSLPQKRVIAPSLLSADFGHMAQGALTAKEGGAEYLHFDVMDGAFVPPITFGPQMVSALRPVTDQFFDIHLMIEHPERQIESFAKAGANGITVHLEACTHLQRVLQQIREAGLKAGVAFNPHSSVEALEWVLDTVDLVLVMTVNPGYGGQKFLPLMLHKIAEVREIVSKAEHEVHIEVDGGITPVTAAHCAMQGATAFVAGTSVYGNPKGAAEGIAALKGALLER